MTNQAPVATKRAQTALRGRQAVDYLKQQGVYDSVNQAMQVANTPSIGAGAWTVISGPSTPASQFSSATSPTTTFTPAGGTGAYTTTGTIYTQDTQSPCTNLTLTARALIGNATVVNTTGEGYLTFWPADATQSLVATSNYVAGQVFNRYFTVGLSSNGSFNRFARRTTDLVIDISGFFAP